MKVQITNVGIQQMAETGEPLNIVKYVLGSDYGYTPTQDATGIKGEEVYTSSPTEIEVINANVYKYQIGLDYNVGNFNFGEVALYDDKDNCVAVGVSEDIISKLKTSGSSGGNSVILGVYMSMAAKNYAMWIDALASDNQYSVPILESVDNLSTTADAYPNFYIVRGASSQQSSILAYTSKDGLWYFDAYSYEYQIQLTVTNCTPKTIQFSTRGLSAEEISSITTLRYFGDKIIEFTSGQVYSICRNIKSIALVGQTATISLATPLAITPVAGDTFIIFSRSAISTSTVEIPVATADTIGGVKPGKFLQVNEDGSLDVTLNNATEDEAGLVKPGERLSVEGDGTLNYVPTPATEESIGDIKPGTRLSVEEDGTLNYVPTAATADLIGDVKPGKRLTVQSDGTIDYVPTAATEDAIGDVKPGDRLNVTEDGTLNYVPKAATVEQIGDVRPGDYLSVRQDGTLDVDLSRGRLMTNLAPFNESEALLQLSKTGDEIIAGNNGSEYSGARVKERQLTYGALYFAGLWDATTNSVNGNTNTYLADGGLLVELTPESDSPETEVKIIATLPGGEEVEVCPCEDSRCICPYHMDTLPEGSTTREEPVNPGAKPEGTTKEYAPKGYIYQVSVAGSEEIDGISDWKVGDLVYCDGSSWKLLNNRLSLVEKPDESGFIFLNEDKISTKGVQLHAGESGIAITDNDTELVWDLTETGVEAGEHAQFITVDEYGRVTKISDRLTAGIF